MLFSELMLPNFSADRQEILQTPSSNTGSNSQPTSLVTSVTDCQLEEDSAPRNTSVAQCKPQLLYEPWVDYVMATFRISYHDMRQVVKLYNAATNEEMVAIPQTSKYIGNRKYDNCLRSPLGTQLYWIEDETNELYGITEYLQSEEYQDADMNTGELSNNAVMAKTAYIYGHISIPGKPLNVLGLEKQLDLFYEYYQLGIEPTRIDPKVRDFTKTITVSELHEIARRGDYSGFREFTYYSRETIKNDEIQAGGISVLSRGQSLYFGTTSSDKRIVFYDANETHGVDALDIEVRFRNARAKAAFRRILFRDDGVTRLSYEESAKAIHRIVSGAIDFIIRTNQKNISRLQTYEFWKQFKEAGGEKIRIVKPKKEVSLKSSVDWLSKQVSPTLAILKAVIGKHDVYDFIEILINQGEKRLNELQKAFIKLSMQSVKELKTYMYASRLLHKYD